MSTKEKVLEILKRSGSRFVSGQEMAEELFVTRAAIWKAIKGLESDGYELEAVTNRGYRIISQDMLIDEETIREELDTILDKYSLNVYKEVDSTNDCAKSFAKEHWGEEAIFLAGKQTNGRGRRDRKFYSPDRTGIYMSILLYPEYDVSQATSITCMMAEAVCRAIEKVAGISTDIKWVNDIFYKDKKIAGILTEGITSIEDGRLQYVVIGVGINLYVPYNGFPAEIKNTAGALFDSVVDENLPNKLITAIIKEFDNIVSSPNGDNYTEGYKKRSMLIGKYVRITQYGKKESNKGYAYVYGVDDDCHLLVRYDDGRTEALSTGEVSVVKY